MAEMLKIGDEIIYRPNFGTGYPIKVTVENMEVTAGEREKNGETVEEVEWDMVRLNRVIFDFDNGRWGYSDAVEIEASLKLKEA